MPRVAYSIALLGALFILVGCPSGDDDDELSADDDVQDDDTDDDGPINSVRMWCVHKGTGNVIHLGRCREVKG